jgi:iron transport multicopper oxidase
MQLSSISTPQSQLLPQLNPSSHFHLPPYTPLTSYICRATINNQTYLPPIVPTLYTALSAGRSATNPLVYGHATNSFVLKRNEVVEIVVNNFDIGGHPWHLHGHNFQVVARSGPNAGRYDPKNPPQMPGVPMRRDTVGMPQGGFLVLRFKADNPGVFLFHCRKPTLFSTSTLPPYV